MRMLAANEGGAQRRAPGPFSAVPGFLLDLGDEPRDSSSDLLLGQMFPAR
ncbi:MAG: hypothetical protein ABI609_13520 [Acidobacteriota bacterium]